MTGNGTLQNDQYSGTTFVIELIIFLGSNPGKIRKILSMLF